MPVTKSATQALRVDRKRTSNNKPTVRKMKTAVKLARMEPSASSLRDAYSAIDRAKKHGIIKPNAASRLKSRLVSRSKKKLDKSPFVKAKKTKISPKKTK